MRWHISHRYDPRALPLANRHYNRQSPESPQFVPLGRCVVLLTEGATALWVSSWPLYVRHAWPGAWVNTLFRNELPVAHLSSELIAEAVAATRAVWGAPPLAGIVTFVDSTVVRSRNPGCCYRKAGWSRVGVTEARGLIVLRQLPSEMPPPCAPVGYQASLGLEAL